METIDKELKVDLLICKRGGTENYKGGTINTTTDKAALVEYEVNGEKKTIWLPLKMIRLVRAGTHYYAKAHLWKSWERVSFNQN